MAGILSGEELAPNHIIIDNSNRIHDEYEATYLIKEQETSQDNSQGANGVLLELTKEKKKALLEFRSILEDAILGNSLFGKTNKIFCSEEAAKEMEKLKDITLWGVPLLPSKGHQGTDVVLLKFLKAKRFKVNEAFEMLRKTLKWRKDYKADSILEENFGPDIEKIMHFNCEDRDRHPVCFSVYGALNDNESFKRLFKTRDKYEKFLRLKVHFMEKGLKQLSFKPGGVESLVQITDLKNAPRSGTKTICLVSRKALRLFQENYPEVIHRNIVINVSFWCYVCHTMSSKLESQITRSKVVYARPSNATKTLLKFISPENLPVEYGGLNRKDNEFFPEEKASELIVKKNRVGCIQIPVPEVGVTIIWDLTVVGWNVHYKEEFIPDDQGSYTVLLQDERKKNIEESIRNSFYINEPGKIIITIDNTTLKKKRVFYRFKTKPTVPMYAYFEK